MVLQLHLPSLELTSKQAISEILQETRMSGICVPVGRHSKSHMPGIVVLGDFDQKSQAAFEVQEVVAPKYTVTCTSKT